MTRLCPHLAAGAVMPWVVIDSADVCVYCLATRNGWRFEQRYETAVTLWQESRHNTEAGRALLDELGRVRASCRTCPS